VRHLCLGLDQQVAGSHSVAHGRLERVADRCVFDPDARGQVYERAITLNGHWFAHAQAMAHTAAMRKGRTKRCAHDAQETLTARTFCAFWALQAESAAPAQRSHFSPYQGNTSLSAASEWISLAGVPRLPPCGLG
jgi:hypothetical protein